MALFAWVAVLSSQLCHQIPSFNGVPQSARILMFLVLLRHEELTERIAQDIFIWFFISIAYCELFIKYISPYVRTVHRNMYIDENYAISNDAGQLMMNLYWNQGIQALLLLTLIFLLLQVSYKFLNQNFEEVMQHEEINQLPLEDAVRILTSDELNVSSEESVLWSVV